MLLVVLVASSSTANPRETGGLWLMGLGQGGLGFIRPELEEVRWWMDVQGRWRNDGESLDAVLVRPGLGYALTERITLFAGYAWVENDPRRRKPFSEHRIWQQLTWNVPAERFALQSRTRLEQRFIDEETGWRLREFVKLTVPLRSDRRLFLSAYDELFFDLDETDWGQRPGFRQNRAFLGLGWVLDEARQVSLEAGYLNVWLDPRGQDRLNHILSLNVFLNFQP